MTFSTQHWIGESGFDALASAWDSLVDQMAFPSPFQFLTYQRLWWQQLGRGELIIVGVFDGDQAVAIAPLMLEDGVLQFNASKEETDYLDLIAAADDVAAAWEAVFEHCCSEAFPAWNSCDLWNIHETSPSLAALTDIAAQRGFSFAQEVAEVCPVIELQSSFDDYLAAQDKKQRHEIKRKLRRAAGAEAELVMIDSAEKTDDLTQDIVTFLDLLQKSTGEKGAWLNDARSAVFQGVAEQALANGTLRLMFAEVEGQRVAALFNLAYKDRLWVYNSGLDPDSFGHLSIGVVLSTWAIQYAIDNGLTHFDFMRGNEGYKYRFGAQDETIYRLQLNKG